MGDGQTYAWLVVMGKAGTRYALEENEITIGRGTSGQIRLKDPKISRAHARITLQGGQLIIEDLKSAHGVFINGQKIEKIEIKDGDQIQLGDTHLILEIEQDSMGTVMVSADEEALAQEQCRYCSSPITEGQAYCSMCGATTRELPDPFGFIQQAYLQLQALYRSGKMDAATFRSELEKMIVSDGSGGYWMVGIQSGRWHWFNGTEWIQRDPPSEALSQGPIQDKAAPPPLTPPPLPPPGPGLVEIGESKQSRRLFLIGGGVLIAFSILAIGAYTAYRLVNSDDGGSTAELDVQPLPGSTIPQEQPPQTVTTEIVQQPVSTPTPTQEIVPTETPDLPYAIRPYDPGTDETLSSLADFAEFMEAQSNPKHAIFEGSWNVQQPAIFNIGWCAIDALTLNENLQVIQMDLEIDDRGVESELMFADEFGDSTLACRTSRIVVEFLEPGEHRLVWTTSYSEPIFDGWQTLEAGTYLNEYVFEVRDVTTVEDEFNESSGKWDETVQQNFSQWTEGGSFNIQVHKENFAAWSIYHDLEAEDILILTKARRVSAVEGAFGLIFRYQDVSNFYYFLVDDSGYFTLGKRIDGEWTNLIDWTFSDTILAGDEFNSLGIMATGNELVAFINLHVVGEVVDNSFAIGGVGLIAQSINDQGEMYAEFDQFSLEHYE